MNWRVQRAKNAVVTAGYQIYAVTFAPRDGGYTIIPACANRNPA